MQISDKQLKELRKYLTREYNNKLQTMFDADPQPDARIFNHNWRDGFLQGFETGLRLTVEYLQSLEPTEEI